MWACVKHDASGYSGECPGCKAERGCEVWKMLDTVRDSGNGTSVTFPYESLSEVVSNLAAERDSAFERGRESVLALVRAVWPIKNDCGSFIPTCDYCGSQRGDKTGEDFEHENSCAWLRLSRAVSAESTGESAK